MNVWKNIVKTLRVYSFQFGVVLFFLAFPFSESLISMSAAIIVFQLFISGYYKYKWQVLAADKAMWSLIAVYGVYLIGCIFCKDISVGMYELKKAMFWVFIPLGVAVSPKLPEKRFWQMLLLFVISVTLSTFVAAVKIVFQEKFHITDIRDASYVSHVSFSFQIILSIFILIYGIVKRPAYFRKIHWIIYTVWMLWLAFFLIMQKSLLGLLSLYGSSFLMAFWLIKQYSKFKRWLNIAAITIFILPIIYIGAVTLSFYHVKDKMPDDMHLKTAKGNTYSFSVNNKQKENGHYVHWFVCKNELEEAWHERTGSSISDYDESGFKIYYTLVRYMTSKNLKKDAEGLQALTDKDIHNIKNGVSNYIFVDKKYSLYPRIYQTIWEIDEYRNTGNPNNQSLSQRFEYVRAAIYIIKHNWFGIGTGNFKLEFAKAYEEIDTQLRPEFRFHVHNQYLGFMVKFGILGLLVITFLIVYPIYKRKQWHNLLLRLLLIMLFISNMGEAILETHVGLSFFLFFISFFLWHSPNRLKDSI